MFLILTLALQVRLFSYHEAEEMGKNSSTKWKKRFVCDDEIFTEVEKNVEIQNVLTDTKHYNEPYEGRGLKNRNGGEKWNMSRKLNLS